MAAPPPAGTATARKVASSNGVPVQAPPSREAWRAALRVVRDEARAGKRKDRSRLMMVLSVLMVVGSLLIVVVGQAMLANGQVRMSAIQHQLSLEQAANRQNEIAVQELEMPSRIVAAAQDLLHMVHPTSVTELPYVPLTTPLPTPKVTTAPASTVTSSTTSASTP